MLRFKWACCVVELGSLLGILIGVPFDWDRDRAAITTALPLLEYTLVISAMAYSWSLRADMAGSRLQLVVSSPQ